MVLMQYLLFSKIKVDYVQTNYNEVVVLQRGDVLLKHICGKSKHTHKGQRDVREKEESKKENGSSSDNLELFCTKKK